MNRTVILSICALTAGALGASCSQGGPAAKEGSVSGLQRPGTAAAPQIGESCQSSDPHHICLAIDYVAYKDSKGTPIADEQLAASNIQFVNTVWKQCDIGFQIEKYEVVDPAAKGLAYGSEAQNQLDQIRTTYGGGKDLLVVMTGPWPGTVKNAWTEMPGGGSAYGAIIEGSVVNYPQILTHELGHYLNLPHIAESPDQVESNVMNWMVFPDSTQLNPDQCTAARKSAQSDWKSMLR